MWQLHKFVTKEISTALELLKTTTSASHDLLHARLDVFEIRLAALERSSSSSNAGSLRTVLQDFRVTVQALQVHTRGKRKRDEVDELDDEPLKVTYASEAGGASSNSASARVIFPPPLPFLLPEPAVTGAEIDASEATSPRYKQRV
ncbi:hypothetical protein K7X08_000283 [Anisodus acutangulus]|uniref:Uncharacterized protein n=1 Tax=Anisodus acutangulus TaxID=402998 RepID=A0A9Q1RAU1_9SOLA|nr:hypothetical protein K7X08_000283 [Anisodus acutangulus]